MKKIVENAGYELTSVKYLKDKNPKTMLSRLSGIGVTGSAKFQNAMLKPVTAFSRNAFLLAVSKNCFL